MKFVLLQLSGYHLFVVTFVVLQWQQPDTLVYVYVCVADSVADEANHDFITLTIADECLQVMLHAMIFYCMQ